MDVYKRKYSKSFLYNPIKALVSFLTVLLLAGCYTTSPYFGQQFAHTTTSIPIQAWTFYNTNPVKVECVKASAHGWPLSGATYTTIANLTPGAPLLDTGGSKVYPAGGTVTIPFSCWNSYGYSGSDYITNVRITQVQPKLFGGGTTLVQFDVFDKTGLECLGRETGKAAVWTGAIGKGCEKKFTSGESIKYLVLYAKNY
jgi:hypothetical protein